MFHVVLYQPEIPPNTGNIIRLCANVGASLHLIGPLGFTLDNRKLKRAGLDYHEFSALATYDDIGEFEAVVHPSRVFAFTTKGTKFYSEASFRADDALLFGSETRGIPPAVLGRPTVAAQLRIPMRAQVRSLNLSNAVAIALYEAWRQCAFACGR